jgi:hypothetical protein
MSQVLESPSIEFLRFIRSKQHDTLTHLIATPILTYCYCCCFTTYYNLRNIFGELFRVFQIAKSWESLSKILWPLPAREAESPIWENSENDTMTGKVPVLN